MSSIILCCFPRFRKHVQLIKRVYPSKPGEEGPKSSQLSYLLFYATYRPGKLKKIGNYLVRRVERDARKERDGHHKTTLAILNALMDECHAHLNLFGKNVIKILYRYIKFGDVELVKMASVTYMKFNSYYDGRLSSDPEFENDYLQLLDLFCHLCTFDENVEKTVKQESILAGLEAIKSIAFSNFLFTTRCEHYIAKILPPILSNIKKLTLAIRPKSDAEHNYLTSSKRFSIFDDLITEDELGNLALSCLQKLVRSTNAATAGLVLDPTFDYIEQNNKWWPSDFACVAARGIAQSGSTQVKTMLVASLLSRMQPPMRTKPVKSVSQINASTVTDPASSPPSQPGNSVPVRTRITLVKVLGHVIADQSNTMIAISVYELVDAVMAQLSGLPAKFDNEKTEGDQVKISGVDEAAMILMLRRAVYRAIENLLIHPQYPTQPKDIINHLVVNYPTSDLLSPELKRVIITSIDHLYSLSVVANPASPESHNPSNNLLAIPSMMVTVNASVGENLKEHVNGSLSGSSNGIAGGASKKKKKDRIRPEILVGALEWLVDLHPDVRHVTQKLLIKLLSDMETASWPSPFTPDEVQIFRRSLLSVLFQFPTIPNPKSSDFAALYCLFTALLKRYKQEGVVDAVPVLLKFESAAVVPTNTYRLLSNIVLKIFYFLSESYSCNSLKEYLILVKESRNEKKVWCNVLELNGHSELELSTDISDLIDESSLSVMMDPISSAKVIDCLCQIEQLAHEFPDLHKRLIKEYPPKATDDGDDEGKEEEWKSEVDGNQKLYKPRSVLRFDSLGENEEDKKRGTYEDFKAILEGKDVNIKRVSLSSLGEIPKWPKGSQEFSKFLDELIPEYVLFSLHALPSLNTDIDEFCLSLMWLFSVVSNSTDEVDQPLPPPPAWAQMQDH